MPETDPQAPQNTSQREEQLARDRENWAKNKDRYNRQRRERYQENPTAVHTSNKKYYQANREKAQVTIRAYTEAHPDVVRKAKAAYRERNREILRAKGRAYVAKRQAENPEAVRAYNNAYNAANRDKVNAIARRSRLKHHDLLNARQQRKRAEHPEIDRAWRKAHPEASRLKAERYRTRKLGLPSSFSAEERRFMLEYWHNACAVCGNQDGFFWTLADDHWICVNSPECPGTIAENIVPLCHTRRGQHDSCNLTKKDREPKAWLISRVGPTKAKRILKAIETYFAIVRARKAQDAAD